MKGLKEYLRKHGRHFTEELAHAVMGNTWTYDEIDAIIQKKVYYNVSGCTKGDIVYFCNGMNLYTKHDIIKNVIPMLMTVDAYEDIFTLWAKVYGDCFDFTEFV